jgi:hypothetical protein
MFANYLPRIKVVVHGTRIAQYLNGDLEGRTGRVLAAQAVPDAYEQTVRVQLDDAGGERALAAAYLVPVRPQYSGEEVLVLAGAKKGRALVVREKPEDADLPVVVSSRANPADIANVPMKLVVALYEEAAV